MVRIGWLQDTHVNLGEDDSDTSGGSYPAVWEDINTMDQQYGVDQIVVTGDLVCPADNERVPHALPEHFDEFWRLVSLADNPDLVTVATPGNHDVPLASFLRSDERCVLNAKIEYEGVVFLLPNTHPHGFSTGGLGDEGRQGGMGTNRPHISYRDLQWLKSELDAAGTKTKVVLPHAATAAIPGGVGADTNLPDDTTPSGRRNLIGNARMDEYEICQNHNAIHALLRQYDDIVVANSHWQQRTGGGASTEIDGVHYVWKNHYWNFDTETANTFGVIDASADGVTVTEVEHDDGTEYTTLDTTPIGGSDVDPGAGVNPVHWWPIDAATGPITDRANGQSGTLQGATIVSGDYQDGYALSGDGESGYAEASTLGSYGSQVLNGAQSYTFTLETSNLGFVLSAGDGGGNITELMIHNTTTYDRTNTDGPIKLTIQDNTEETGGTRFNANTIGTEVDITDGQRRRVAITIPDSGDPRDASIYINGESVPTTVYRDDDGLSGTSNFQSPLTFLRRSTSSPQYLNAILDNVAFYGTELTASEVTADHNAQPWT